jgi:ubiquinone/menaquinone biosynthesis C-methylase UbiE
MTTKDLVELLTSSSHFALMPDAIGYLERMDASLLEKLRIAIGIPKGALSGLDVGCANGTTTIALAKLFPHMEWVGVDIDEAFIEIAKRKAQEEGVTNVRFVCSRLHDLQWPVKEQFDVVIFCSVLHEFFSYGYGISSVTDAIGDAQKLLRVGGVVIIRDMLLDQYSTTATMLLPTFSKKIGGKAHLLPQLADFVRTYGEFDSHAKWNHFALKYLYKDNWSRELGEDYTAVTIQQMKMALALHGFSVEYVSSSVLPFLDALWRKDFGLTDEEVRAFLSTTIMIGKKWSDKPYFNAEALR